jgi:lipopolysaccharide export system permease protein
MLFDRALKRQLTRSFTATLVVVLTIVLTMMLVRTLRLATRGGVAPEDIVLLLGYTSLAHLGTIISLSAFVAIVLTLGRMYRDSEMPVWFACGIGLRRFVRPVFVTMAPMLLLVAALLLVAWPWLHQQSIELRESYRQRSDLARVSPGLFQASADGSRVFFVDRDAEDDGIATRARNVFVVTRDRDRESVTSARDGHLEIVAGDRHVVLGSGQRTETDLVSGDRSVAHFESYRIWIDEAGPGRSAARSVKAMPTLELLRERSSAGDGELAWRFGLTLASCHLVLLGIGLAQVNPRRISNWNLLFALLAFIVVFNLVNLSQAWVASGRIGLWSALLAVHGSCGVIAWALVWWRDHATTLQPFRPRLWPWPRWSARSAAAIGAQASAARTGTAVRDDSGPPHIFANPDEGTERATPSPRGCS